MKRIYVKLLRLNVFMVLALMYKKWNLQQVGCNHCTGLITAQKFVDAGYPVVKGTARFRSKTTNYLGNGDVIKFPA